MAEVAQTGNPYLKAQSGPYLFWCILAYFMFIPILYDVMPLLDSGITYGLFTVIAGFVSSPWFGVAVNGIWFALLLLYGLFSNIKTYRILFIILASTAVVNILYGLYSSGYFSTWVLYGVPVDTVYGMISPICWVASLVIMIFTKRTGALLRVAAILLCLNYLLTLYDVSIGLFSQNASPIFINGQSLSRLYDISFTLFFFALSFTHAKPHTSVCIEKTT